MKKLRVWWVPQIGIENAFYVPVNTPEDGKRLLDTFAAYDMFEFNNNVKPDYCNTGGLEMWDEDTQEWVDWYLETDNEYFEDIDEYCESDACEQKEELEWFSNQVFGQDN